MPIRQTQFMFHDAFRVSKWSQSFDPTHLVAMTRQQMHASKSPSGEVFYYKTFRSRRDSRQTLDARATVKFRIVSPALVSSQRNYAANRARHPYLS